MKFDDEVNNLVNFLLEQTVRKMRSYAQRQLDTLETGITVDQWVLLKIIEEHRQISQVELAQTGHKDAASVTRILDILQKKGLIQRIDDELDRRKYMISLTPEGKGFVAQHLPFVQRLRARITQGLTDGEIQALKGTLEKIRQNLE